MKCKIDGCDHEVMYVRRGICQMHYFRMMRTGSYEIKSKEWKYRTQNTVGYQMVHIPGHLLAMANGYTYEHRAVIYSKYGERLPPCEICGKELTWESVHIDHIDENVKNNQESNLRPLCNACNVRRGRIKKPEYTRSGRIAITCFGETKTPNEWARDPRISISNAAIVHRKKKGMSDVDALLTPPATHNGKKPVKKLTPPKYTRKNAMSLEWFGEKKTPAEWAADPRISVTDNTIRARKRSGMSDFECLFNQPRSGKRKVLIAGREEAA